MRTRTRFLCSASLLASIALASAAAAQTQPSTDAPAAQAGDEVVVTGLRRSIQSAQNIKRNSDAIVDAIVAEDIGKLPDVTASESLARVTGVQVTRAAGEAADVAVRGLPNVTTTYNGREIFTADGRNVAIQDFPAGTVQALEVYKSGTADMVEPGIGGLINVRSRKPFDFAGREISGSINGVYFEQADKTSWNGNLLLSDRWTTGRGDMGLLVNLAYTSLNFLDSTREQSFDVELSSPTQSSLPAFRFPNAVNMYYGKGERWRPSANVAFQWRPSEELEVYADALYQGYRGRDADIWNYNPLWGNTQFTNVKLRNGGKEAVSLTSTQPQRSDGFKVALDRDTDTWQVGVGAVWRRDRLKLSADVATTHSVVTDDQTNLDYAYRSATTVNAVFDTGGDVGGPAFSLPNFNAQDPNNVIYRGLFERRARYEGDDVQVRGDLDYQLELGPITSIQAGLRYTDRDAKTQEASRYSPGEGLGITMAQLAQRGLGLEVVDGFVFDSDMPFQGLVLPTRDAIKDNLATLRQIAGFPNSDVAFNGYGNDVNEKTMAGYVQARYAFEGAIPIDGVIGVRGVRTKTEAAGTVNGAPFTASTEYTDWLPNVSARAHLREDLQFRLSYTETRTRPNFGDLNPSYTIDNTQTPATGQNRAFRNASGGRVDLDPYTSANYDATLEWYFARTGSATAAVFKREVKGFIDRRVEVIPDPQFPGGEIRFNRPYNAGSNDITGFELGFTSFLDVAGLPAWTRDFGVQANYTRLKDDGDRKLSNLSEDAFNLIGLYETERASARLAYNYRSDFIEFYTGANGVNNPVYTDARGQLDFSASYTPMKNVTIAFDVGNITGEPLRRYRAYNAAGDTYPWNIKYLERVYSLGLRFRF